MGASYDIPVEPPAIPADPTSDFYLFDPETAPKRQLYPDIKGIKGVLKFDQAVTLYVEQKQIGGASYVPVNNAGAGDAIAAGVVWPIEIAFVGDRTRVRIRTGATPPTAEGSLMDYRLTRDWPIGGVS